MGLFKRKSKEKKGKGLIALADEEFEKGNILFTEDIKDIDEDFIKKTIENDKIQEKIEELRIKEKMGLNRYGK